MKVTDIRRKLAASLVAGGLMFPAAGHAADLDTNLVSDPGFEDVNSTVGAYGALQLNSWSDGSDVGFTYAQGQYDNGGPLASGGSRYFSSNQTTSGDADAPGEIAQLIDVSTGATGAEIAAGEASINLSGFFTTYDTNEDFGTLQVDFLDAGSANLGSVSIGPTSNEGGWTQHTGGGVVPPGTATLQVSVFGTAVNGGPDGYIDNVDVQVSDNASDFVLFLEVNTATGAVTLNNQTGEVVNIDYYEIVSGNGLGSSLQPENGNWSSFQDQDAAGFPAGNGSGNGWEEAGFSDNDTIGESHLTGNSAVADSASLSLGDAFNPSGAQDLTFRYGLITEVIALEGDYNNDNVVDAVDYAIWRDTLGDTVVAGTGADGDDSGVIDTGDYDVWKADFGNVGGPGGISTLTTGFVRYVNSAATQVAGAPEPSTMVLVGLGMGMLTMSRRRQTTHREGCQ